MLEYRQANKLYLNLTDEKSIDRPLSIHPVSKTSIRGLLYNAYKETQIANEKANFANPETTRQLNIATTNLNKAQIKLNSLQSGLATANAAALAS